MKYTEPISKILPADKAQISAANFEPLEGGTRFISSCFKIFATKFEPFISALFLKRVLSSILALLVISLGVGVATASAQNYTPLVPLPGTIAQGGSTTNLSTYLAGIIKLLIALGGALAILFAIIGGTQYVAASTNPSLKEGAKERLMGALIGLAIILTSYLLLNSINPKLVEFNLALEPVTPKALETFRYAPLNPPVTQATVTELCNPIMTPLDEDAQRMENLVNANPSAPGPIWSSTDPGVQSNLTKLHGEVTKLQSKLALVPASATVNSAYRPLSYQKHLFEVFKAWAAFQNAITTNPSMRQVCPPKRLEIEAEHRKHGLGTAVSTPTICSPHVKGTGVDIKLTGIADTNINAFMMANQIDLKWQGIYGDEVHFNLQNPPYTPEC